MATRLSGSFAQTSASGNTVDAAPKNYDGINVTGVTGFTTLPIKVEACGTLAIQFSCPSTGTPNGSFAIQGSNDASGQESKGQPDVLLVNWSTLTFFDEAAGSNVQSKAVAGASSFVVTIPVLSPRWLRLVWSNSSGVVTPTIRYQQKAVA